MNILHLADLHIGKRLKDYSFLEDQETVLEQALQTVREKQCSVVMIAGDIYDKPAPSTDAMQLFDKFLSALHEANARVYMISGNHDASGKIAYLSDFLRSCDIFTTTDFDGHLQTVHDPSGIDVHLLRFIRPADVKNFYPEETINTYADAVRVVLEHSPLDATKLNILIAHQFIMGAETCDSEQLSIGGMDEVPASLFDAFDYVALGHMHKPQYCGKETVRYAGSLLKYSVSEESHQKSFTVVHADPATKEISYELVPIQLPHDIRTVRGSFRDMLAMDYTEDYVRVVVTDEVIPPDARMTLRTSVFPRMLQYVVENSKTKIEMDVAAKESFENKSPLELFVDFFRVQCNEAEPSPAMMKLAKEVFLELEEEQK